jgi:molybdopterin-binding protein
MGISFPTIKGWIASGKIKTFVTPGGHHRIPASEVARCIKKFSTSPATRKISGRNQLVGTIVATKVQGLMAQVTLRVGDQVVNSIITRAAFTEMRLRKGDIVAALIKSTEVMVMRDFEL